MAYPANADMDKNTGAFRGVIPILATPFADDESLDLQSWGRLIEFMVGLGVAGVTVLGVLGESNRLTDRERETLIQSAVTAVNGRVPVIVGASHPGTRAAAELARTAQELGADAIMVAPVRGTVPDEDSVVETYRRIADGLAIPIVLQDHPASTEVHMSVALMLRLVREIPAIQCIKEEAVPAAPKIRGLRADATVRRVPVLTGLGALYAPFDLEAGSDGFNTGFAFPEVLLAMTAAACQGDWRRVHDLYGRFAPLIVFEQQPGVTVRKEILRRRGLLTCARVRHPGVAITPVMTAQIDSLLERTLPGVDIRRPIRV